VSDDTREMLRELVREALAGAGNGTGAAPPQVPAPPVAAVLRPSTWREPPRGGEVIGSGEAVPGGAASASGEASAGGGASAGGAGSANAAASGGSAAGGAAEPVTLRSDADLDRFVRTLADRFEDPRTREAVRSGRLRFALRAPDARKTSRSTGYSAQRGTFGAVEAAGGVVRIERGAVTERTVEKAAKAGARLVLARGAVPTPLARERARALGIEIERE
jgi:hypothetical protein